jgi:teichuronic acid exporter
MSIERAATAGLWSTIDIGSRLGVQFVVTIILARLLMPADFGIIALLAFFSSLATVFVQGGLLVALIQRQETTRDEESATFWWNLLASLGFALLLILLAPQVARFYGYPVLRLLMFVDAAQVVISALGAVQTALLIRTLRFADLAKAGVPATIVSGAAGIGAALLGAGVWALAIQLVSMTAANTIMLWWVCDWRPSLHARLSTLRPLIAFGAWFGLSSTLEILYSQGFALIVGKLYGMPSLGLYNRAANTQLLPSNILSATISRVALPLFSARGEDPERMRQGLKRAIGFVMLINLPVMTGMALLPDLIILALFGEKWLPAAPILAILAWGGLIFPLHVLNLQVMLAQGRSGTYFRVEMIKKVVGVGCLTVGSIFGILGLALSQLIFGFLALFINVEPIRRNLGYGVARQIGDVGGTVLITAIMAAAVVLLRPLLHFSPLRNLVTLVFAGAAVYVGTGFALRVRSFLDAWSVARLLLRRAR